MNKLDNSYFRNIILLLLLAVFAFLGFKQVLPKRLFPEIEFANDNILVDSMMLTAMTDTIVVFDDDVFENDSLITTLSDTLSVDTTTPKDTIIEANNTQPLDSVSDENLINPTISGEGFINLSRFYAKLYALEQGRTNKVRVAYFGDSMNDGDLIVQDIRSEMQEKYGGRGVGFVAITSLSATARGSVSHKYSPNWTTQSFVKVSKPTRPFGIDGQVFYTKQGSKSWVKYKAQSRRHSASLYNPTLFYGQADNDSATVAVQLDKDIKENKKLTPTNLLNTMPLSQTTQNLELYFQQSDSVPIYGINFDDNRGIHIDNFSIRGNSGLPLSKFNTQLMNAFDRILSYDLVVLQYGANVLSSSNKSYGWYEKNMTLVIGKLRKCFPNADILIISAADKSTKVDDEMKSDPAVELLVSSQKKYASRTGAGYINLYNLMGGNNSMLKWVEKGMAGQDYTHFSISGSKKVAKLIYDEIDKGYSKYKTSQNNLQLLENDDYSNDSKSVSVIKTDSIEK